MSKEDKIVKRINKRREKEYTPPYEPDQPFKRQFSKTKMSWPLYLLYKKKYSVFITIMAVLVLVLIALAFFVWYLVIPGTIKLLEALF